MLEPLELRLLGQAQITYGGRPVTGFVSNKAQALLCYLAISRQPHTRDDLAALLWSDMPEAEAKANLRVALCNLRHLLPQHIIADRKVAALNPQSPCIIDVDTFQASIQQYESGPGGSISHLYQAVAIYQGDLLHGLQPRGAVLFEEWLLMQREQLRQQVMQSHYTIAAYHLQRAEYAEALAYTTSLIKLEPWHEEAHRQAMLLFALNGQRHLALVQYKTCREILRQEFGVEPEEETRALYQRIQADLIDPGVALRPAPTGSTGAVPRLPTLSFVGRGDEFDWLMRQYEANQAGGESLALIQGAAGAGKTHLAEEMLRFVSATGGLLLHTCCRDFSRALPYQPVIDLLRSALSQMPAAFAALPAYWLVELRQLLPELQERIPEPAGPPMLGDLMGRQRLFDAVAALLTELVQQHGSQVVIFLDDLHNADVETIDLLNYLIRQHQSAGIWYLGAYRPEAVAAGHALPQLYHSLRGAGRAALLKLDNLSPAAVTQLVAGLSGLDADAVAILAEQLYSLAGGSPILTTRLIEDLVQRGLLCMVRGSWWLNSHQLAFAPSQAPPEVREIILGQVRQLSEETRMALYMAAVIGQGFDLDLLARSLGLGRCQASERIRPLLAQQILRETGAAPPSGDLAPDQPDEPRYSFVSPLVWNTIQTSLSSSERHWLVEQIGAARRDMQPRHAVAGARRHAPARAAACHRRVGQWRRV